MAILNAASGVLKTVIIAPETTWGVSPAASSTSAKYARRTTCDLSHTRAAFESAEINATAQITDARTGTDNISGKLTDELSVGSYSDQWEALLRGTWTAGVTTTATTIAAVAATSKLTNSASWLTAGFKVGDLVKVSGFATAANNGQFIVLSVSASDLVLNATLTNEAAGASVTVAVPGKKLVIPLTPAARTDKSYTIEQYFSNIGVSYVASGVKFSSASVKLAPDAMGTVEWSLLGKDMKYSSSAYFTAPTAADTHSVLAGNRGTIVVNGAVAGYVTGFDFEVNGNMEAGKVVGNLLPDNTRPAAAIFLGTIKVSGTFTAYFTDAVLYEKFRDDTAFTVSFTVFGDGNQAMIFKFPRTKISSATPNDVATGGIVQTCAFTATLNDGTDATVEQSSIVMQEVLS